MKQKYIILKQPIGKYIAGVKYSITSADNKYYFIGSDAFDKNSTCEYEIGEIKHPSQRDKLSTVGM